MQVQNQQITSYCMIRSSRIQKHILDGKRSTTRSWVVSPEVMPSKSWVIIDLVAATPLCCTLLGQQSCMVNNEECTVRFLWEIAGKVKACRMCFQGALKCGASGLSGSGLTSSFTLLRSIPAMDPINAWLLTHADADEPEPPLTTAATPV